VDGAVDAIRRGAYDYISKPYDVNAISWWWTGRCGIAGWRPRTAPEAEIARSTRSRTWSP